MSDLFGNHIVVFPTRRLICSLIVSPIFNLIFCTRVVIRETSMTTVKNIDIHMYLGRILMFLTIQWMSEDL